MTMTSTAHDPLLLERARKIKLLVLDVDGVLTDGRLYYDQAGNEMKSFCTRDGFGIRALQQFDVPVALITGRQSKIVKRRAEELGIEHVYQGSNNKLLAFNDLLLRTNVCEQEVCFAGDDWIDIPVLDRVGLSVSVSDADELVQKRVHWVTRHGGGTGAVREICDLILKSKEFDTVLLEDILNQ